MSDKPEADGLAPALTASEILAGVNDVNFRLGQVTGRGVETAAYVFALAQVLIKKGVLSPEELEEARATLAGELHADAQRSGLTVEMAAPEDKYALGDLPVIDCDARLHLCRAACCRLRFPLSEQDIAEGVVQWTLAQPYLNRQRDEGYCVHCSAESLTCSVYANRPAVCRVFDCRDDQRIWLDFENRIVNPEVNRL